MNERMAAVWCIVSVPWPMTMPWTPFSISRPMASRGADVLLRAHVLAEDAEELLGLEVADVGQLGDGAVELARGEGRDDGAGPVVEPAGDRAARPEELDVGLLRVEGELLFRDLVVGLLAAGDGDGLDRAGQEADVVARTELDDDVVGVGRLRAGQDDAGVGAAGSPDLDVAPDHGLEILEHGQGLAPVAFVGVVAGHQHVLSAAARTRSRIGGALDPAAQGRHDQAHEDVGLLRGVVELGRAEGRDGGLDPGVDLLLRRRTELAGLGRRFAPGGLLHEGENAVPGDRPVAEQGEDPAQGLDPERSRVQAFLPEPLAELDEGDGRGHGIDPPVPDQHLEQPGQARHGQGLDDVRRKPEAPVPGLAHPDGDGDAPPDPRQPLLGDPYRRQVRVRIHPVRPGQDALEAVGPVLEGLARLGRDAGGGLAGPDGDLLRPRLDVFGRAPDDDHRVVRGRLDGLADGLPLRAREGLGRAVGMDDVGEVGQAGDDPDAVGDLAGKARVRLGRPGQQVAEAAQDDGRGDAAGGEGVADGQVARVVEDAGDVLCPGLEGLRGDAAAEELLAQPEQVPLAHGLVVGQERDAAGCAARP